MSKLTVLLVLLAFGGVSSAKPPSPKRKPLASASLSSLPRSKQIAAARAHLKRGHLAQKEIEGEARSAKSRREVVKYNCLRGYAKLIKKSLNRAEGLVFDLTYLREAPGEGATSRPAEDQKTSRARAKIAKNAKLPRLRRADVVKKLTEVLDKIQRLAWEAKACTGELTMTADLPAEVAPDKRKDPPPRPPLASPARP